MKVENLKNSNNDLFKIGSKFGTDKVHSGGPTVSYLNIMNEYLSHKRNDKLNILEIGVREGNSILTWEEYFPNAKIYGIDIDDCTKHNNDRIKVIQGDQSDEDVLKRICEDVDYFDIIIDDGGHINTDIITSFNYLFDRLRLGGLYMIEDLSNSYSAYTCGENKITINKRGDLQSLFNKIIHEMDKSTWGHPTDYMTIHFYPAFCIISKL